MSSWSWPCNRHSGGKVVAFSGLKPHTEGGTLWVPLSDIAKEFSRPRQTIAIWCRTGFILTIGYRAKRDHKGHWYLAQITNLEKP